MTNTTAPNTHYALPAGTGMNAVWWKTGRVLLKAGGEQTGGRLAQIETIDPLGTAPPMHIHHREDETFFVVEGEITVLVDGDRIDLGPGDFAMVPRGVAHAYIVRSEQARILATFSPAGFEEAFFELGVPVDETDQPEGIVMPPPEEIVRALAPYGCEVVGPPPTIEDLR